MEPLALIVGASLRSRLRWAKQHIYSLLILGPTVVWFAYLTAAQTADNLNLAYLQLPDWAALTAGTLFALCLIALSLSRATAELYHLGRAESVVEALPVSVHTHLHAALLNRLARVLLVTSLLVVARWRLVGTPGLGLRSLAALLVFTVLIALAQLLAALNWIHWGHKKERAYAAGSALILTSSALLGALLLASALKGAGWPALSWTWLVLSAAGAAVLYVLVRLSHKRWRGSDVEFAKRLKAPSRSGLFNLPALARRLMPAVAAQLARDLHLTLRGFSSAVYVAAAMAALWIAVLLTVVSSNLLPRVSFGEEWLDATWLPPVMATKIACILAVASLGGLVPVLVAHEMPNTWLERAIGTTGAELWEAKLWYARVVSMPAPLAAWFAGLAAGEMPGFYLAPALAECLWLWWLVSSIIGALSYEVPGRPMLALILLMIVGLAAGLLTAMAWPVGAIIYAQAMHSLAERGRARARYYLLAGED